MDIKLQLLTTLTAGLKKLRSDFDSLPNFMSEIDKLNQIVKDLQNNQLTKDNLKEVISLYIAGFLATTKDEYITLIEELVTTLKNDNQAYITNEVEKLGNQIGSTITTAINSFKSDYQLLKDDLTRFKSTIKNGVDGRDGIDGKNGLNGKDGVNGINGKDGLNGVDGIGIKDITLENSKLIIELDNNIKKTFNLPQSKILNAGGGVSKIAISQMIDNALLNCVTETSTNTLTNKTLNSVTNDISADRIHFVGKNLTHSVIPKNTVVTFSGTIEDEAIRIRPCQIGEVAIGITYSDIPHGEMGMIINTGRVDNYPTSAYTTFTILYPSSNGTLTNIKPTTGIYQEVATVIKTGGGNSGALLVEFSAPSYLNYYYTKEEIDTLTARTWIDYLAIKTLEELESGIIKYTDSKGSYYRKIIYSPIYEDIIYADENLTIELTRRP